VAFVLDENSCLAEVEVTLEIQNGLFEANPQEGSEADGGGQANCNNHQIAGDSEAVERLIHVAAEDGKDEDVGDVEAVADFPDEQERTEGEGTAVERRSGANLAKQGRKQHSAKADGEQSVSPCRAAVEHERDAGGSDGKSGACYDLPCSKRPVQHAQGDSNQGADGEAVEMGERVGGGEAVSAEEPHQGRSGEHGGGGQKQPAGRNAASDRRPEEIELLLNGKAPGGADGSGKGNGPEVLDKEEKKKPGSSRDVMEHPTVAAEEEREKEVVEKEQHPVDRPDAEETAGEEVGVEARRGTGVENDSGDEEAGEDEEETDAAPSPGGKSIEPDSLQSRLAMVEDNGEDGDAAKSIECGDEGGQPRRAQAPRRKRRSGNDSGFGGWRGGDCRGH